MKRINARQAAEQLGVSPTAVREYAKLGLLSSHTTSGRTGRGQRMYFDSAEVAAFAKGGATAARSYREQQAQTAIPKLKGRRRTVHA